ncbi:hypothetical protein KFL_000490370 [Klebsormidium nitens]|uniref:15-cis-phytoene synthase n=1 Tax=Klebsormidium nitens TaxID=105231 RepID=A0A0U9HJ73_KLENI|nr:hypothetical protein KFL_000490370 [Klebsormidium nitens]|eukprot:GAQ80247.1 hypothetical protein KFL_000490370 [Klebsormidium nitens]
MLRTPYFLGHSVAGESILRSLCRLGRQAPAQSRSFTVDADLRPSFSYCVQQVQKHDYEHYLCALQLPPQLRAASFALRAFNVEIAQVGDHARELILGQMRMVWWRDAIDSLYKGKVLEHPVLKALAAVSEDVKLTKRRFTRLIEARNEDLDYVGPPRTLADLESYAESTASGILYLTLEAAGIKNTEADHAASHIGKASGLALLLRATPVHSLKRRTYLPLDVTGKHGVVEEDIYQRKSSDALNAAVFEVADAAKAHLEKAQSMRGSLPAEALPILLPAIPVGTYLDSLQRHNFDVFSPHLARGVCGVNPLWLQSQIMWKSWRRTF